jgi:hypothetical protein
VNTTGDALSLVGASVDLVALIWGYVLARSASSKAAEAVTDIHTKINEGPQGTWNDVQYAGITRRTAENIEPLMKGVIDQINYDGLRKTVGVLVIGAALQVIGAALGF